MEKLYILELSVVVAILNIFDGIFTSYGVTRQFIEELNPLLKPLTTSNPLIFLILKFVLSITLIYVAYKILAISTNRFKKWFYFGLIGVSIIYIGIFSMHLLWITQI